jgi:hypothetical protein
VRSVDFACATSHVGGSRTARRRTAIFPAGRGNISAADERVVNEIKAWRYKPLLIDGKPVAVCTALTFIYSVK